MPAHWLIVVSWVALALGFTSALVVAIDVYGRGHRQQMGVMDAVWPVTGLYSGPLAV